jgi:hypothetical protein
MIKRIFTLALVVCIVIAIIIGYFQFKEKNTPISSVLSVVSENAVFVATTSDAPNLWEKFTHTSVIWEELKHHVIIEKINNTGNLIDSLLRADDELNKLFSNKNAVIALVPMGAESFQALYAINTPPGWNEAKVAEAIGHFTGNAKSSIRVFNELNIYAVSGANNNSFFWSWTSGVLVLSSSQLIIEDAIRVFGEGKNLLNNQSFTRVKTTIGIHADANIYINYQQLGKFTSGILNEKMQNRSFGKMKAAHWSGVDASLKPNQIMLNGFVDVPDSGNHFFNVFYNQQPQDLNVLRILPSNTANLLCYTLSDANDFYSRFKKWQLQQTNSTSLEQEKDDLNKRINADIEDLCLSWIGKEIAAVVIEQNADQSQPDAFFVFQSNNTEVALENLKTLSNALDFEPQAFNIGDKSAEELQLGNCYGILLGDGFRDFNKVALTTIGDYVVVANSTGALRNFIQAYETDKTLRKDLNFNSFIENVGTKSTFLLYNAIARSPEIYRPYLKPEAEIALNNHLESLRNFEGFAFQLVNSPGQMMYSNIFLRHNPVYIEPSAPSGLWKLELEAEIVSQPKLVVNHYTNAKEIVVQDRENNIYLISNTGKVLWKKKLDGIILGEIEQIDIYKNGKLQMLFNTAKTIYLLDRNGNSAEKFPIKLPHSATAPIGLFDYDNDKEYRILAACQDKQLRLYDAKGETVKGWNNVKTKEIVTHQPRHLRLGKKDYLFACDKSGSIYLLDRQGKSRHKVKEQAKNCSGNRLYFSPGKDIKATKLLYTDTLGNLVELGFDNGINKTNLFDGGVHHFLMADLNDDKREEIIIYQNEKLIIHDLKGEIICSYSYAGIQNAPILLNLGDKHVALGIVNESDNLVYAVDHNCQLINGFPQSGSSLFTIGDINKDGILNAIVIISPNVLIAYNLQ